MTSDDIDYKARWSEEEISELIRYSNDVLEVEIPLAKDIRTTVEYLQACRLIGRSERDRMFLVAEVKTEVRYKIRFLPSRYSSDTEELPIPEDVLMCAYNGVRRILDNKCDYLAERSGYKEH
jgi:hypothetical protein